MVEWTCISQHQQPPAERKYSETFCTLTFYTAIKRGSFFIGVNWWILDSLQKRTNIHQDHCYNKYYGLVHSTAGLTSWASTMRERPRYSSLLITTCLRFCINPLTEHYPPLQLLTLPLTSWVFSLMDVRSWRENTESHVFNMSPSRRPSAANEVWRSNLLSGSG